MLPSVAMQGGPDPEPTFAAHPASAGADQLGQGLAALDWLRRRTGWP